MSEPVTKKILVKDAKYYKGDDAIVIIGECSEGQVRHLIPSSAFTFGDKDKVVEMEKLADLLLGKNINIVFDPDLDDKIKDKYPLRYNK